ncbi:GAF domain-like protein [Aulographum hederae CBS 113979]|uniref:GAF domain-like protein n=1 Tax=Aulographum hederae CBS 113979 TaxID=1176131 RepID=A0A6G1GT25_9PEZI|nr:GAF domain-like protein [Aulographum hederae CBS 113979]
MVHAEASTFANGQTKAQVYEQVLEQAEALFEDQRNWVCNLSNASSLIYHALKSLPPPSSSVNWCGFYVLDPDPKKPSGLILGPFQGHVACQTIPFARGVCGTAASTQKTQLVLDVDAFPGHIACDSNSKSEIVVPIVKDGVCVAIIDIDCAELGGFDGEDAVALERMAGLLARSCNF